MFIFCLAIGGNMKELSIAIKSDEINYLKCPYYNSNNRCITDAETNQMASCVIMNYYASLDYKLVSEFKIDYHF